MKADTTKKGSEKIIRKASSDTASTVVWLYASLTKIAFVEKQTAPANEIKTPARKYEWELVLDMSV